MSVDTHCACGYVWSARPDGCDCLAPTERPTPTPEQGSAEWLAQRRGGIGGSEISALYRKPDGTCAHPWMSQVRLWGIKTGRIEEKQPTPQEAPHLYLGKILERPVREMYEVFSGRTVVDGVTLLRDSESPVLIASTDGEQRCSSRPEPGIYEGKVTTVFRRKEWFKRVPEPVTGEEVEVETVPPHYHWQCQHYMACTGLPWATAVAFIQADRQPIQWRDLERHDRAIDDMRERAARWWRDYVVADVQPPVDDSPATEAALREIHREAEDTMILLPAAFAAVIDRLEAVDGFTRMLKREKQRLRNLVLSTLGPAVLAMIADDGRGWSLRGDSGCSLRSLTAAGVARARKIVKGRSVAKIPTEVEHQVDVLFSLSAQAFAPGQALSAKAIHLAQLAALAAQQAATE